MKRILLTQGKFALVDDDDYEQLCLHSWFAAYHPNTRSFYAVRAGNKSRGENPHRKIKMHRVVMKAGVGEIVDHIHHDSLDNRKSELRICTRQENAKNRRKNSKNTSGFKGVSWNKRARKFIARINTDGRSIFLGYFTDAKEAVAAYNGAAKKYHGEFAFLNKV